jgi:glycolate oxidase FAD binding subunit
VTSRWDRVLPPDAVRAGAAGDAVSGVVPAWVLTPPDVESVSRVVASACDEGRAIVPSGCGRHLDMAGAPRALDALVRLSRLDRVVAHDPADMTVTVQAGCTLSALDAVLATAGQWLPLDPPCPEVTTVGGLVAANLAGLLRTSHGTVRDWLIGITVVGAGGALIRGGGRVVKNVAGYDVTKLHAGAFGTTGVIVEATFKVKPRPACERACVFEVRSLAAACELALAVRAEVEPTWIEVERPAGGRARVCVGFGGSGAWAEEAMRRVARLGAGAEVSSGASLRAELTSLRAASAAAVVRVATLPAELGAMLAGVDESLHVVSSAAAGVAHLMVSDVARVAPLVRDLREWAPRGSVVVVERGVPEAKRDVEVWGSLPAGAAPLMRGLKRAFDPAGVFAPGVFVAGI